MLRRVLGGNKCAENGVPGDDVSYSSFATATVGRGLNFPWFNWARNHFRCNTRADAAATSSNHRKSSTPLSHSPFSRHLLSLFLPLVPTHPFPSVESKKPPSSQSLPANVHLAIPAVCYRTLHVYSRSILRD